MTLDLESVRIKDGVTPLNADELNRRFFGLVRRLHALEQLKVSWEQAVAEVANYGVERINEAVQPLVDELRQDMIDMLNDGQALLDQMDTHLARKDNPHRVTCAQIGAAPLGHQHTDYFSRKADGAISSLYGVDLDTVESSGFYRADTACTNKPAGVDQGYLTVLMHTPDYIYQYCHSLYSRRSDESYVRIRLGGTWLPWSKVGVPVGHIMPWPGATAPAGYMECSGAAISRTVYNDLFDVIGTTHGAGDGATTYNIPDLRGEFVRGWDNGRGVDAGRLLGSFQDHALQDLSGELDNVWGWSSTGQGIFSYGAGTLANMAAQGTYSTRKFTLDASRVANTAAETRPRNIALMFCIKY